MLDLRCCVGFSLVGEECWWGLFSGFEDFSCCGAWVLGMWASVAAARELINCTSRALEHRFNSCGAQALWHVGSSQTRDWTHVSCTCRRVLYHWATREVPVFVLIVIEMFHFSRGCRWPMSTLYLHSLFLMEPLTLSGYPAPLSGRMFEKRLLHLQTQGQVLIG